MLLDIFKGKFRYSNRLFRNLLIFLQLFAELYKPHLVEQTCRLIWNRIRIMSSVHGLPNNSGILIIEEDHGFAIDHTDSLTDFSILLNNHYRFHKRQIRLHLVSMTNIIERFQTLLCHILLRTELLINNPKRLINMSF